MKGILKAIFGKKPATMPFGDKPPKLWDEKELDEYFQRLPGFPQGIPAIPPDLLLDTHGELINKIVRARGLSGDHNKSKAAAMVISPIRHLARMVHLLPASENQHYKRAGGLFEFSLEVAYKSIHFAESRILTRVTPEIRRETEQLWAHAAFLNGLYSEAVSILSRMKCYIKDTGDEWHLGGDLLYDWLEKGGYGRYLISWRGKDDLSAIYSLAGKAITQDQSDILAQGEVAIYKSLWAALIDQSDFKNPLAKINNQVRFQVMEHDLGRQADTFGKPLAGMHLEPWLRDAMLYLVERKRWVVNEENGRLWHGLDGTFLVWPLAANDIKYQLKESECPFVPKTDSILANLMLDADMIDRSDGVGGYLYEIGIPVAESDDKKMLEAVKLSRLEKIFVNESWKPLAMRLIIESSTPSDDLHHPVSQDITGSNNDGSIPVGNDYQAFSYDGLVKNTENQYGDDYLANYTDERIIGFSSLNVMDGIPPPPMPLKNELTLPINPILAEATTLPHEIPSQEANDDLVSLLLGSNKETQQTNLFPNRPRTGKKTTTENATDNGGRAVMLIAKFRGLPNQYLETKPDGVLKVKSIGLKSINLDLQDCIEVLKTAGLLVMVDGLTIN